MCEHKNWDHVSRYCQDCGAGMVTINLALSEVEWDGSDWNFSRAELEKFAKDSPPPKGWLDPDSPNYIHPAQFDDWIFETQEEHKERIHREMVAYERAKAAINLENAKRAKGRCRRD